MFWFCKWLFLSLYECRMFYKKDLFSSKDEINLFIFSIYCEGIKWVETFWSRMLGKKLSQNHHFKFMLRHWLTTSKLFSRISPNEMKQLINCKVLHTCKFVKELLIFFERKRFQKFVLWGNYRKMYSES